MNFEPSDVAETEENMEYGVCAEQYQVRAPLNATDFETSSDFIHQMQLTIEIRGLSNIDISKIIYKIQRLCYQRDNEKRQLQQLMIGVQNPKGLDERIYACDWPSDIVGVMFHLFLRTLPFHRFAYLPKFEHCACLGHHDDTEWWLLPLGISHMTQEHLLEYRSLVAR